MTHNESATHGRSHSMVGYCRLNRDRQGLVKIILRWLSACVSLTVLIFTPPAARADEIEHAPVHATRPTLLMNRWQEDWSKLADPSLKTEPFDSLKYLGLSNENPYSYVSFGLTVRERFESNDASGFGVGNVNRDAYTIERLQLHADMHFNKYLRLFSQIEDDRAYKKQTVSSADQDRLDMRLAFLEFNSIVAGGTFKARVGRQDFAFDLQRFVSSRDGPNVRQSFDAVWADWETGPWRFIGFVSQPVQYKDDHHFDDSSNGTFRFDTLRVERHVLGTNELSAYYSFYERSLAHFGDAVGSEHRSIFDLRFAGSLNDIDWDIEGMFQAGTVGSKRIRAWAFGPRVGYTFKSTPWAPRLGLQFDSASGDRRHGDSVVGTFNPLFPNGYYFSLAGYTGYSNLIDVKPTLTLKPESKLTILTGVGFLWRQTTNDAIYLQPNVPLAGSAGHGNSWSGSYEQLRADYAITRNLASALEAVRYQAGDSIRSLGGHNSTYVGVELKFMW